MVVPRIINRVGGLINKERRERQVYRRSLTRLLEKIEIKEAMLERMLTSEKDRAKRHRLQLQLHTTQAQKKKGRQLLKEG